MPTLIPNEDTGASNAHNPTLMERQPVITVVSLTAMVSAIIKAVVAFGLDIDQSAEDAVNNAIIAAYPIVTAVILWFKVYAPATVRRIKEDAQQYVRPSAPNTKPTTGVRRTTNPRP